jgi:hypothetical protein
VTVLLAAAGVALVAAGARLLRERPAWQRALMGPYARLGGRRAALKVRADRAVRPALGWALVAAGVACLVVAVVQ